MNQVFAGATALIIGLIIWSFGKKPKEAFIGTINPDTLEGLNKQDITLVEKRTVSRNKQISPQSLQESDWQPPKSAKQRKNLQDNLRKLMSGNPEERLEAIAMADKWQSFDVLPILRRGLKDSDSRVIVASASAINKYRGVPNSTIILNQEVGVSLPPRNVARMR